MGEMAILRGPDPYALAEERLAALPGGRFRERRDAEICRLLHETIPTYSWVGIYRPGTTGLLLSGWAGLSQPPAPHLHRLIDRQSRVLNDLWADPQSRPLFPDTRAEAVIPLTADDRSGAIVVASEHRGAFGPADLDLLRAVAQIVSAREQ